LAAASTAKSAHDNTNALRYQENKFTGICWVYAAVFAS
jgi:hypothetical protein